MNDSSKKEDLCEVFVAKGRFELPSALGGYDP